MIWSVLGVGIFAGVHLLAGRFHTLVGPQKRPLHSVLSGITTGYLFLKLLPDLAAPDSELMRSEPLGLAGHETLFALALIGFIVYYAIEVWAFVGRHPARGAPADHVYRVHLGSSAAFNAVAAFLVPYHVDLGGVSLAAYVLAIAVHLLVFDHALAQVHGGRYGSSARLLHSAALAVGLLATMAFQPMPPPAITDPVLAFFGGAVALQVIREEVPAHKEGRPSAFALGALLFALLLLVGRA